MDHTPWGELEPSDEESSEEEEEDESDEEKPDETGSSTPDRYFDAEAEMHCRGFYEILSKSLRT